MPREQSMVPEAEFESYYGRQIIKTPTWKVPDVPLYLFLGGVAGGSALLAEGAALSGNEELEHFTRGAAAIAAALGTGWLVHDLGRPERFLNMLRVFKPTSPLSVGSFILAPFSSLAGAAYAAQLTGWFPRLGRLAGAGSTLFGPPLVTYTAALIANTAVPAWHEARQELPFVFAGSGASAAGGLAMVFLPAEVSGPAYRMALAGAVLEVASTERMTSRIGIHAEVYQKDRPGLLMRSARALTVSGAVLSVLGRKKRWVRALAGAAYVAGSATTRFGIFDAGLASARDPKYIVIPQKERIAERERAAREAGREPGQETAKQSEPAGT